MVFLFSFWGVTWSFHSNIYIQDTHVYFNNSTATRIQDTTYTSILVIVQLKTSKLCLLDKMY